MNRGLVPVREMLTADPAVLEEVVHQTGRLLAQTLLLHLALRRTGESEVTVGRLERLSRTLHEAVEDARAAARSWQDGR